MTHNSGYDMDNMSLGNTTPSQEEPIDLTDHAQVYDHGAQAFQEQAPRLLSWEAVGAPALDEALKPILARQDLASLRWADLGAASGRIVGHLIELGVPASQIDGVEISPQQVALAQADSKLQGAHFKVGNIAKDALPAATYDVATEHMVAEHLNNEQLLAANRNIFQALKPGGTFVMICTHPDRVLHTEGQKIQPDGSYITDFPWGGTGANYYRQVTDYVDILQQAGFKIESAKSLPIPKDSRDINPGTYDNYARQGYFDADGNGAQLNVRLVVVGKRPE